MADKMNFLHKSRFFKVPGRVDVGSGKLGLTKYSDKSFVVYGTLTSKYKFQLAKLGGKYNAHLKGGPGWIFCNACLEEAQTFVDKVNATPSSATPPPRYEVQEGELGISEYSDKSFVVYGEATSLYSEQLMELGGKLNPGLKGGSGWIFSNACFEDVEDFVGRVNAFVRDLDESGQDQGGQDQGEQDQIQDLQNKFDELIAERDALKEELEKTKAERDSYIKLFKLVSKQ